MVEKEVGHLARHWAHGRCRGVLVVCGIALRSGRDIFLVKLKGPTVAIADLMI